MRYYDLERKLCPPFVPSLFYPSPTFSLSLSLSLFDWRVCVFVTLLSIMSCYSSQGPKMWRPRRGREAETERDKYLGIGSWNLSTFLLSSRHMWWSHLQHGSASSCRLNLSTSLFPFEIPSPPSLLLPLLHNLSFYHKGLCKNHSIIGCAISREDYRCCLKIEVVELGRGTGAQLAAGAEGERAPSCISYLG